MGQVNFSSSVFVRALYNIIRKRFTDNTSQIYTDQYPLFAHSTAGETHSDQHIYPCAR